MGIQGAALRGCNASFCEEVVILMFTEFGRRVRDNGSGTDHGSGSVAFVIGDAVKGGTYGAAILIMGLVRAIDASLRPYIVAGDRFQGRICRSKSCRLDRSET